MERVRLEVKPTDLEEFFNKYESMVENGPYHWDLVANIDETMLSTLQKKRFVVFPRDMPRPRIAEEKHSMHITLALTIFADGTALDP